MSNDEKKPGKERTGEGRLGELVKGREWQGGYRGHSKGCRGHGNDVNQGKNKARFALEQSPWLSRGGWMVVRTRSGERQDYKWEQEEGW